MEEKNNQKTIGQRIEEKIEKNELTMRPRKFFILRAIGIYVLLLVLFLVALFLISFFQLIMLELREAALFPWFMPLFLILIVAAALKILDRSIQRAHRTPRIITFLILIILVVVIATVIVRVPFLNEIFF